MERKKSQLVNFELISPNSNIRSGKIKRLTPHCVAGNLAIEAILGLPAFKAYGNASTNYAIGSDSRIGLGVEETNRAWTSSSSINDNQAITFEIANNSGAPDWRMSEKAINSWIDLATDICQFYEFNKVAYKDKPSNISIKDTESWINTWDPGPDTMLITLHRWFAAKACPGDYFVRQLPWIVKEINKRLIKRTPESFVKEGPVPVTSVTITNEEKIWYFFKQKGYSDYAVAGIIGNLFAESGLRPNNLQNTFESKLNMTDEVYTQSVDNCTYKSFSDDGAGYGLAQWTFWSRKAGLLKLARESKTSIANLEMQLDYLLKEIRSYGSMNARLEDATSVREASDIILLEFERPADVSESVKVKRAEYSQRYYDKFASSKHLTKELERQLDDITESSMDPDSTSDFIPYKVRVAVPVLNIREKPGLIYNIVQTLKDDTNVYTIVSEAIDTNFNKWGKLKSGVGWIALVHTKKV